MIPKDLLSQLARLEHTLNDFSFEELTATEASRLKKSFQTFKANLEHKIFTPTSSLDNSGEFDNELKVQTPDSDENTSKSEGSHMLVAKVSHEIRTPLNGIIGFTNLLKEDKLTQLQFDRVNAIQEASYTLMDIINELLEYSKLTAGLETFELVDFNLKSVVDNVMYLCNTLINNKHIELTTAIDKGIPKYLKGDPSKLSQILLNLIGNAIKFVEKGSIHLAVSLKKQTKGVYYLEFAVTDTGIGLSQQSLERIFDAFQQATDTTQAKYGGTGLGLTIVKQIVENLNGNISVSSELGKGTTFRFMIPYQKGNTTPSTKPAADKNLDEKLKSLKGKRILIFEDNLLNQKLIDQRLQSWECKTYVTDNPQYGLNLLKRNSIDIILMDLKMPKMSGFEITERIRKNKQKSIREIPIIAISADFSYHDQEKCKQHKINDFILKPYQTEELLSKLVKHISPMERTLIVESETITPNNEVYADATKINLSEILEDCMGQMNLLEELVFLYKQNVLEFIGIVKVNINNENLEDIGFAAHKVKSGLAMMQSKGLYTLVVQIQKICKSDGDRKHLKFLYQCFIEEYPLVEKAIDKQLKALNQK